MREPQVGDVAKCSRGQLGLVTGPRQTVVYKKCNHCTEAYFRACEGTHPGTCTWCRCETGQAYVGVHLSAGMEGKPWSSRNPEVLGRIEEMLHA